ncbi:hypothetical protein B0H13DRAFT_2266228 [Mycena leptocephala]|nr:hypothetical protein B0H13DRAFT_2266228 [Mycena leptocephala]
MSARRGRPKGSKDKPWPPGAPPRGRPRKQPEIEPDSEEKKTLEKRPNVNHGPLPCLNTNPWTLSSAGESSGHAAGTVSAPTHTAADPDEFDVYFDMNVTPAAEEELQRIECEAFTGQTCSQSQSYARLPVTPPSSPASPSTAELLKKASQRSNSREIPIRLPLTSDAKCGQLDMFFSKREVFTYEPESEDEGMESQNKEDETVSRNPTRRTDPVVMVEKDKAWFKKPKRMPAWLYQFFRDVVQPQLFEKDGRKLLRPTIFSPQDASFWINPLEPVMHKMGPSGVRAMLYEMQTLRYNTLLLQYLESSFERVRGSEAFEPSTIQTTMYVYGYAKDQQIPPFGDFADPNGYDRFIPSASYLTAMMNKTIERDEPDANQHTSCLPPDQIIKYIANEDGNPIFGALFTCMTSRYIRAQALTLTKSHEERIGSSMGISESAKRYGLGDPLVAYTDDPIKDKVMLYSAFPSLAKNLAPMAAAHGLKSLTLPNSYLSHFKPLIASLDADMEQQICSRGVCNSDYAPFACERDIYHPCPSIPKITSFISTPLDFQTSIPDSTSIQGDLARLKKRFNQLNDQSFQVIDLKQFALQRGLIQKKESGSLDVLAEKLLGISETASLECVQHDTSPGTRVAILTREGGEIAAYGQISSVQTPTFAGIRVKTSNNGRVLVAIDHVLIESAAAIIHVPPSSSGKTRTKVGALTLAQLKSPNNSPTFSVVAPISLLQFDRRPAPTMLESHAQGVPVEDSNLNDEFDSSPLGRTLFTMLNQVLNPPTAAHECYTRIKKENFHAFHMIPLSASHGLRAVFLRTLRDHMMRWDPAIRAKVDKICLDQKANSPLYNIPPPSILVPAIEHVFNFFGDARDAESGQPLFNNVAQQKAQAILELAGEGYLSDPHGVVLYEKAGVDQHGLDLWHSKRGTNKVEGGPHGDIYRKFAALRASVRLTVNSMTDHRTQFNLQAMAKHLFGVDWEYHHDLGPINRTSFLLNYLSDIVDGASSYAEWMNADLYERTTEKFGVCPVPDPTFAARRWPPPDAQLLGKKTRGGMGVHVRVEEGEIEGIGCGGERGGRKDGEGRKKQDWGWEDGKGRERGFAVSQDDRDESSAHILSKEYDDVCAMEAREQAQGPWTIRPARMEIERRDSEQRTSKIRIQPFLHVYQPTATTLFTKVAPVPQNENGNIGIWILDDMNEYQLLDEDMKSGKIITSGSYPHLHACGVGVLHEQHLTQMGVVWMELADEDEDEDAARPARFARTSCIPQSPTPSTRNAPSAPIDTALFGAKPHCTGREAVERARASPVESVDGKWAVESGRDQGCGPRVMKWHASSTIRPVTSIGSRVVVGEEHDANIRGAGDDKQTGEVEGRRRCVGAAGVGVVVIDGYDEGAVYHVDGAVIPRQSVPEIQTSQIIIHPSNEARGIQRPRAEDREGAQNGGEGKRREESSVKAFS